MSNARPPMHQTLTPFVEFFINGVDILRDVEGRPRTLVSFEHYITLGSTGDWSIEVFDPSFVSIEELCFVTQNKGVGTETLWTLQRYARMTIGRKAEMFRDDLF